MRFLVTLCLSAALADAEPRSDYPPEDVAVGKRLYNEFCASCHGLDGKGDSPERSVKTRPLDLTGCSFTTGETDFDWETVIYHGGPAAGLSADMAAWGESLGMERTRQLIAYMRSFCTEKDWPRGELNFARPLLTEKAFPENEVVIEAGVSDLDEASSDAFTRIILEKRFGKRGQYELKLPLGSVPLPDGSRASGISDFEAGVKYVLAHDHRRGYIWSAGLDVAFPTGDESSGLGTGTPVYEPFFLFGKRLGTWEVQAQVLYEHPHDRDRAEPEIAFRGVLGRPLTSKLASPWAFVELTYDRELEEGAEGSFALTPQVRLPLSRRDHMAMNVGVQIPVSGPTDYRYRVLFYFLWEYLEGGIWW